MLNIMWPFLYNIANIIKLQSTRLPVDIRAQGPVHKLQAVQGQPLMAWNCLSRTLIYLYLDVANPHRTCGPSPLEYELIYADPEIKKLLVMYILKNFKHLI